LNVLIFPHHENEIAQSEALFGKQFVKYWVHNGFVDINNEKMSKSLGNFTMIKDVLETYHPEVIRLFLLSKHYRSPIDYNEGSMDEVITSLDKIYTFLDRAEKAGADLSISLDDGEDWQLFVQAMDDDFNSARGMATIFDAVKKGNRMLDRAGEVVQSEVLSQLSAICVDLKKMGEILGILSQTPTAYFEGKKEAGLVGGDIDPAMIDQLVIERTQARKDKNFARADEIRAQLDDLNIILEDGAGGTTWKFS